MWCARLEDTSVGKPDDNVAMLICICFIVARHCEKKKLALNYAGATRLVNELFASILDKRKILPALCMII